MDTESVMFDFKDFYRRVAQELPDNSNICECGVADGESALFLANEMNLLGKDFKLYMVDNMDYGKYEQMKTIYQNIILSGLGLKIEVVPYDSVQASKMFNDNYFNFVFIDTSHEYEETKESIRSWYPKVKDEYMLAGHDYEGHPAVKKAVDEVIPVSFTRDDIPDRAFEPENILHVEQTSRGYGLWHCRKQWYVNLNK